MVPLKLLVKDLLHVGVCCKLFLSQELLKGSKEMGIARPRTSDRTCDLSWRYGLVIMDHPNTAPLSGGGKKKKPG